MAFVYSNVVWAKRNVNQTYPLKYLWIKDSWGVEPAWVDTPALLFSFFELSEWDGICRSNPAIFSRSVGMAPTLKKKFAKTRKLWMNSKRGAQPFCGGGVTTRHGEGCGRVARDGCVSWRGINFANAAGSRWKMQMKRRCFVLFYLVFGWPRFIITAFKSSLDKVFKYIFFRDIFLWGILNRLFIVRCFMFLSKKIFWR